MTIDEAELGGLRHLRTCVRLHCRDLPKGLGQTPGCRKHRRGRLIFCFARVDYRPVRTELITRVDSASGKAVRLATCPGA
jgi:hypothetical protein